MEWQMHSKASFNRFNRANNFLCIYQMDTSISISETEAVITLCKELYKIVKNGTALSKTIKSKLDATL